MTTKAMLYKQFMFIILKLTLFFFIFFYFFFNSISLLHRTLQREMLVYLQ